jgi:hypothetical protein
MDSIDVPPLHIALAGWGGVSAEGGKKCFGGKT